MPQQPPGDRLRRRLDEKNPLPRDEYFIEPHLTVELVVATAQRGDERVVIADGYLAADSGNARGVDRHDEARVMLADLNAIEGADIDILGIGRAGVHADLATDNDAGIGLANEPQGVALERVFAQAIAERRGATTKGQKPAVRGD